MKRREILKALSALVVTAALPARAETRATVMTVTGPIAAAEMGLTLPHEHVVANFQAYADWAKAPAPYDRDDVVATALPYLVRIRDLGCRTFVDPTGAFLGRDPFVLKALAERSGLHILMATGNYAADHNRHLPPWVYDEPAEALARRWVAEFTGGIDGSGVRAGFIKLSFDGGPLNAVEQKLVKAAALAHLETGMTIGVHTGGPGAAQSAAEQQAILTASGVHPSARIWIHAQNEPDLSHQIEAARAGTWIEFDGVAPDTLDHHLDLVTRLRDEGLLSQVLVSQDAGWYHVGAPGGGAFRGYDLIFTGFIPGLKARGFTDAEIATVFVSNPAKAFALKKRAL